MKTMLIQALTPLLTMAALSLIRVMDHKLALEASPSRRGRQA